jgi:hypothetical protein
MRRVDERVSACPWRRSADRGTRSGSNQPRPWPDQPQSSSNSASRVASSRRGWGRSTSRCVQPSRRSSTFTSANRFAGLRAGPGETGGAAWRSVHGTRGAAIRRRHLLRDSGRGAIERAFFDAALGSRDSAATAPPRCVRGSRKAVRSNCAEGMCPVSATESEISGCPKVPFYCTSG